MKKILLVDDDEEDIEALEEILGDDYEIVVAEVSHDAIRLAEEIDFDLLLIDVYLPGIDGFDIVRVIQASKDKMNVPFIFLTSERDYAIELECLEIGAEGVISKPYSASLILNKVKKVIEDFKYRKGLENKVEKNEETIEQVVNDSKIDHLTGIYNRSGGVELWIEKCHEYEQMTIFMMDIDNFKQINDTYGHVAGDEALSALGKIISENINKEDLAIRVGGDEFIICVMSFLSEKKIKNLAEKINKKAIEKFNELGYRDIATISCGVVRYPEDGMMVEELYRKADKALYTVKLNGKNGTHLYDEFLDETSREGNVELKNIIYTIEGHLDTRDGAFQVEYNDFKKIYNFVRRYLKRYPGNAKMVVFTLGRNQIIELDTLKKAMNSLEAAVSDALRNSDVSTKYNSSQYVVLIMNVKDEDIDKVVSRVEKIYERYLMGESIELSYEVKDMQEREE
ncbi:diguanylate cyclase [Lachnospira sp.]|jgi:diguanylate cyclase (GGDEF)-like protein|uniref:diguanylate cyclase n=1 Tax=Lachnospira sp. TaxID=2049031 RepID=UPI00257E9D34|nr:diguanylate cyclase [Lachnospira sp.]